MIRGGYGLYYDSIYMKSVLQNNGAQNISVFGPGLNPAGSNLVCAAHQGSIPSFKTANPFSKRLTLRWPETARSRISTFERNFRPSYTQE